jgi:hypothetical protein
MPNKKPIVVVGAAATLPRILLEIVSGLENNPNRFSLIRMLLEEEVIAWIGHFKGLRFVGS